ncbi:MAG: hypothetical protein IPK83_18540 [Planctomycetes bacterium]|nr:hypothetical protein [Planctomycetota bacterium]
MNDANETNKEMNIEEIGELLDSFQIKRIDKRNHGGGGTWVMGTIGGHKFEALVFAEHAECESYELDKSKISKLWLQKIGEPKPAAHFDRGWDVRPTTKIAQIIVESLCESMAETVFE